MVITVAIAVVAAMMMSTRAFLFILILISIPVGKIVLNDTLDPGVDLVFNGADKVNVDCTKAVVI